MKKKLLSLVMACAMILALAAPSFAADYYGYSENADDQLTQTVQLTARTFVPTVRLFLPNFTGDSIVLNPYKISYVGEGNALNGETVGDVTNPNGDSYKQVISPVYAIKNETDVKMNFTVAATGTVEGGVTFAPDFVGLTEANKKAHITVVFAKTSTTTAPSWATTAPQTLDGSKTDTYETITLKTTETKSNSDVKYLEASTLTGSNRTPNYLPFQFQGDLSRSPKNGWTADDKVGVTMTFTFTPESMADGTATKTESTAVAFADTGITQALSYSLSPTASADISVTSTHFTPNATDPKWQVISSSLAGVEVKPGTAPAYTLEVPVAAQKNLPKDGNPHPYKIVLGCVDKNGMPRTLDVTYTATRASS